MRDLKRLFRSHAGTGVVDWIGLRAVRLADVEAVTGAYLGEGGLEGDHARPGKRAVTLIQAEHLPVIAGLAQRTVIKPETLRRNIMIRGINLTALRHNRLRIGGAVVQITVQCAPCSRMEKLLGPGGYNAMRGHGGWCAEVLQPGRVTIGDRVEPILED